MQTPNNQSEQITSTPADQENNVIANADNQHPEKEDVFNWIKHYYDTLHSCVVMSFGPSAWFCAFLQSAEFAALSNENKAEAFTLYKDLNFLLEKIDEICEKHNAGEYENCIATYK